MYVFNPKDPNPAMSARSVFPNLVISARKNSRFFPILPPFSKEYLSEDNKSISEYT